jgi:hypothetical protein
MRGASTEASVPPTHSANPLVEAWNGRARLALVWWGFGIPLKLVSWALNSEWTTRVVYGNNPFVLLLVFAATTSAYVVLTIMAWRCAPNVDEAEVKWIARVLLVLGWIWFAYQLMRGTSA